MKSKNERNTDSHVTAGVFFQVTFYDAYIKEVCVFKMVDKDGRNFRAFYYDTLGLRNVEQRKALEILLKDDPIGW